MFLGGHDSTGPRDRVPESMERREQRSRTNPFSSDKVSENWSDDFDILSNDYDILDKIVIWKKNKTLNCKT